MPIVTDKSGKSSAPELPSLRLVVGDEAQDSVSADQFNDKVAHALKDKLVSTEGDVSMAVWARASLAVWLDGELRDLWWG